jgi:hypothetical protein
MAAVSSPESERLEATELLAKYPLGGQKGVHSIFRYLWRERPVGHSVSLAPFHIPHTVTFKAYELDAWIYTDAQCKVKRKAQSNVTISELEDVFSRSIGATGLAACLIDSSRQNGERL